MCDKAEECREAREEANETDGEETDAGLVGVDVDDEEAVMGEDDDEGDADIGHEEQEDEDEEEGGEEEDEELAAVEEPDAALGADEEMEAALEADEEMEAALEADVDEETEGGREEEGDEEGEREPAVAVVSFDEKNADEEKVGAEIDVLANAGEEYESRQVLYECLTGGGAFAAAAAAEEDDEPDDEEDESFVTMVDVLEEERKLEEDAHAVLGASDEDNCTYGRGYVGRQALYACLTCASEPAGVCLACSYHCHEGHELVELYTKRQFRCDCGNSKFSRRCELEPHKEPLNEANRYNHNFRGTYCTCARPYPDAEDSVADDMIQCVVCEDWFHCRHLAQRQQQGERQPQYAEMTCGACVAAHPFLLDYAAAAAETEARDDGGECTRPAPAASDDDGGEQKTGGALFWGEGWRARLCTCDACAAAYREVGVEFLTDGEDTVHAYEQRAGERAAAGCGGEGGEGRAGEGGAGAPVSSYEQGLQALSAMERTAQLEAISHYNHMKDELKDYLQAFARERRIVTETDIRDFFDKISAKRPRLDIPYTCR